MAPASGRIEVLADHIEILHQAAAQPIQRRLACEEGVAIRPAQPGVRGIGPRQQDLQGLVDPQDQRHALELIEWPRRETTSGWRCAFRFSEEGGIFRFFRVQLLVGLR